VNEDMKLENTESHVTSGRSRAAACFQKTRKINSTEHRDRPKGPAADQWG
jgi:hypothetical protein